MDSQLAAMLPPLPSPAQMRAWDQCAIDFGIPENMLMENASRELCAFLKTWLDHSAHVPVCIFMGGGNNGGDAAALARHLLDLGATPLVFHSRPLHSLKGACAWHAGLAQADGVPFVEMERMTADPDFYLDKFVELCGRPPAIMVDGLLGTGFHGSLSQDMESLINGFIRLARICRAKVLAIDVPSGLDAMTGMPRPVAIEATATITLAAAKPGLILPHAKKWTGLVQVRKIGMPAAANLGWPADTRLLDGRIFLERHIFAENSFKNIFGHVLVAAGAGGTGGAARLACSGALRAGAGLVTCCAPAEDIFAIKNGWPEVMTRSLGNNNSWPASLPDNDFFKGITSIVIGPGIGLGHDSEQFLEAVLAHPHRPRAVIDADALTILGRRQELAALLAEGDIITPHPGEAASILGCHGADVQADRRNALLELCKFSPAVAVLKGAATLIGQTGQPALLCPYDIPQLAIGGSGDVLAGCAGALLGFQNGKSGMSAAATAVAMHAMAGLLLERKYPDRGARASELADALAKAPAFVRDLAQANLPGDRVPWP